MRFNRVLKKQQSLNTYLYISKSPFAIFTPRKILKNKMIYFFLFQ